MFVLLWTVVDDYGRCHADPDDLAKVLYPQDFDVPQHIPLWLDELEREGCIARYEVEDIDYLHIVHWKKHQRIYHPTPSYLPPPPDEALSVSGIREVSGKLLGRDRKIPRDQQLGARSGAFPENIDFVADPDEPVVVDQQILLHHLDRIRANAEADGSHANALRSVAMLAELGMPDKKDKETPRRSPSLSELNPIHR